MMLLMTMDVQLADKRPVDDELIRRIAAGDMQALHNLYGLTHKRIYHFALSITKNTHDADDVLQETFLKVYAAAADYRPQGKALAWMFTIARHLALHKLRERGKTDAIDQTGDIAAICSQVEDLEQRLLLEALLRTLSEDEKQIVLLHAVSGLRYREIATILQLPLNTVLSKYHRAIKRLQTAAKEAQL